LAHAGCGVPAESMEFPITGTIFSSVVRRIRSLALALHDHGSAVAVVDEPFRGTNVHDAAEATLAVITRLAAHPAALAFVASHRRGRSSDPRRSANLSLPFCGRRHR